MEEPNNDKEARKPEADKAKKFILDLDALVLAKVPVETSIGTVYVAGHGFPASVVEVEDAEQVGREVVQRLCGRQQDKQDRTALADVDLANLTEADIALLGPVISMQERWPEDGQPADLVGIGNSAKRAVSRELKRASEDFKRMRDSLASDFSFLKPETLSRLQGDVSALSALREFKNTSSVNKFLEDVRKQQDGLSDVIKNAKMVDDLLMRQDSIAGAIKSARKGLDDIDTKQIRSASIERQPLHEHLRPPTIVRPEDSRLGRAALQNAENSKRNVELMSQLTQSMAALQETIFTQVLPQWFKDVERRQEEAKKSAADAALNTKHAAASLLWTQRGIFASILVTVAATIWQVKVSRDIDAGNTEQLQRTEKLLQEQLAVQRQALEQQHSDMKQLRETLQAPSQQTQPAPATDSKRRVPRKISNARPG